MKTLYLVRHAKSSWSKPQLADFDRGLSKRGKRDAPLMGGRLAEHGVCPDLILASPAKRAKKTAKIIAKAIGYPQKNIVFERDIYSTSVKGLLRLLQKESNNNSFIFLVGHNHTITEFAELLTGCRLDNLPTCGIVAITFPVSRWGNVKFGVGKLDFFDYPKKHLVKDR